MSHKKRLPLVDNKPRALCPVCGMTSYSAAGIHPQCAVRRADKERMGLLRIRLAEGHQTVSVPLNDMSVWKRICPVCHQVLHVRAKSCSCGKNLPVKVCVPRREGDTL